jgi:hypothetical protein
VSANADMCAGLVLLPFSHVRPYLRPLECVLMCINLTLAGPRQSARAHSGQRGSLRPVGSAPLNDVTSRSAGSQRPWVGWHAGRPGIALAQLPAGKFVRAGAPGSVGGHSGPRGDGEIRT